MIDLQDPTTECPAWPTKLVDGTANPNPARTPNGVACTSNADCGNGAVCNTIKGECACLHNGWSRKTEDDSSRVTGSSVFDFNGDGAAEVIYNDECWFRIYNGQNGDVYTKEHSPSRTRIEYPVVADVDNDGNAEIVFATSNESGFCSEPNGNDFNNGIEVWGDATDTWVSARRIWNQHAYHVTNVTEGGSIPISEPASWSLYNTYRSNPRSYGVAPDLVVPHVQATAQGTGCGALSSSINIVAEIKNQGDLRVGPGVVISFTGHWTTPSLDEALNGQMGGPALTYTLQNTLEPGSSVLITVPYNAANNSPGTLPASITVNVDSADQERECIEDNNTTTIDLASSSPLADLRLVLGNPGLQCPTVNMTGTLFNDGAVAASNILVRFYAGDPDQGGFALGDVTIAGPLDPGQSVPVSTSFPNFPTNSSILIYGVADPQNLIAECNDGNNKAAAGSHALCTGIQ
ncbi:MAG: CARDB domain-containing protein [Polyangiaceae bacterium]